MRFHSFTRTAICQGVALVAFLAFLRLMAAYAPARGEVRHAAVVPAGVFAAVARSGHSPNVSEADENVPETQTESDPRRPERFRPASDLAEQEPSRADLPVPLPGRPPGRERITVQGDLPLSYLMKFRGIEEFHTFLESLTEDPDAPTMARIRIEGLPESRAALLRLLRSYRMEPFLFNPDRFNYIVTSDLQILRDERSIANYVSTVGRYLQEDGPNPAYAALRDDMARRAEGSLDVVAVLGDRTEFARMKLGLASPHLSRFLRRLERDTARQLTELTGRPVAVSDIARIDCRFREVNGAMVLVPWKAWLSESGSEMVLWRDG